jgi:hypothetical protein
MNIDKESSTSECNIINRTHEITRQRKKHAIQLHDTQDDRRSQTELLGCRHGGLDRFPVRTDLAHLFRSQRTRLPAPALVDGKHVGHAREPRDGGPRRAGAGNGKVGGDGRARVSVGLHGGDRGGCRRGGVPGRLVGRVKTRRGRRGRTGGHTPNWLHGGGVTDSG